ncbi:conserved hypothetical protein [Sporisorium reilianum SRZ2]|uniref:DUF1279 domain-containing protein n=1 Tax=Sporisorium reilianum (strain SRZ2) TaxID=999809 RepID=E7A1G4_SPORE|nr:conserved hypothetical protein [Sporisorium reilianum SRZ2]
MSLRVATRKLLAVPTSYGSVTAAAPARRALASTSSSFSSSSRVMLSGRSIAQQSTFGLAAATRSTPLLFKPSTSTFLAPARPISTSSVKLNTASTTKASDSKSQSNTDSESEDSDAPPPKASLRERLKFLTRRYGWWALGVYLAASAVDFSLIFLAIHMLGADHIRSLEASLRKSIGLEPPPPPPSDDDDSTSSSKGKGGSGTIWTEAVLAYTIHKTLLLPVRVALTAAVTPSFVKWLVKMGWAKANHQVKAQVGRKAADKAIQDVVKRNAAKETAKHQ